MKKEERKAGRLNGVEIIRWLLYANIVFEKFNDVEKIMNILKGTCLWFGFLS